MTKPAIQVDNLSKAYHIGLKDDVPDSLIGAVQRLVRSPMRNFQRLRRLNTFKHCDESEDLYWALRDVSFEVAEGEVVGIIGRNGAGKSTLLKILSRITEPTSGRATIRGRVSSLLEVGTGFHQELSGRENVYMNGTILGMTKREIDHKFDEIVEFSGVEKLLDTPIKHYSSGMKVRLAFAVAAHLEPEILIIDEVLAVGDAEFQKKCLGKMQDVARGGRTVLFVSHNLAAVQALCDRCFVLSRGELVYGNTTTQAIEHYLSTIATHCPVSRVSPGVFNLSDHMNSYGPLTIIRRASTSDANGSFSEFFWTGGSFRLSIEVSGLNDIPGGQIGVIVKSASGQTLALFNTGMKPPKRTTRWNGETVILEIPALPFVPGEYWLDISVAHKVTGRLDYVENAVPLKIEAADVYGSGYSVTARDGLVYLDGHWNIEPLVTDELPHDDYVVTIK